MKRSSERMSGAVPTDGDDLWVFGYGSLIWRPDFAYLEHRVGYLDGWVRRFHQGSIDHRGVPGAPGRVVTLLPLAGSRCWGVAFRVCRTRRDSVLEQLDRREVGGYERTFVTLHVSESEAPIERALTYVAGADNANFLGEAPLAEIARQVARSTGPSGSNLEYVLRLAETLCELGLDDDHVFELARLLNER